MKTDNSQQHQITGKDIPAHNRREARMAALAPSQAEPDSETSHSPLPWRLNPKAVFSVESADGKSAASTGGYSDNTVDPTVLGNELRANAALIVRSVNAHAALVAALEACELELARIGTPPLAGCSVDLLRKRIARVLAQAKGST